MLSNALEKLRFKEINQLNVLIFIFYPSNILYFNAVGHYFFYNINYINFILLKCTHIAFCVVCGKTA